MFIQDYEPGDIVDIHSDTLAEGPAFTRVHQCDNYKVAIHYEIEIVLSSAFGAITSDLEMWKELFTTRSQRFKERLEQQENRDRYTPAIGNFGARGNRGVGYLNTEQRALHAHVESVLL